MNPKHGYMYIKWIFDKYHNTWNQILVMLREICFSLPSLVTHYFAKPHVHFLFQLLTYKNVFDGCINLIEEILAIKTETIDITEIPNVYNLFDGFTCRQFAILCRVLALLLFEPEDRVAMEEAEVM